MVSQTPNGEWESSNGGGVSATNVRTPPSYVDAVRSRHSLSQSEQFKPPAADRSNQYNSLPRPLPQRFQAYPAANLMETNMRSQCPEAQHHYRHLSEREAPPMEPTRAFQVYSKPPGPANHVPLVGSNPGMAKTSSLPRCFPRNQRLVEPPPNHLPNELQQPLSIIVQQNDYSKRHPIQQSERMMPQGTRYLPPQHPNNRHLPIHNQVPMHRDPHGDRTSGNYQQSFANGVHDPRRYRMPAANGYRPAAAQYHQPNFRDVRPLNAHYSRGSTVQSPKQRRDVLPEPAVSLRTGPLGSYPDSMTLNSPTSPTSTSLRNSTRPHESNGKSAFVPLLEVERSRSREYSCVEPMYSPGYQQSLNPHTPSVNRNIECPLYENREEVLNGLALQKSATLPPRRMNSEEDSPNRRQVMLQQSPLKNGAYTNDSNPTIQANRQYCLPVTSSDIHRFNEVDIYKPQSRGNSCQTPEEAGLVMIVESRDLNNQVKSIAKDVIKPRPRIPISPSSERGYRNQSYTNGTDVSRNSGNEDAQRNSFKSLNGQLLRRTPLSSSTASLNSEMSSVSSRQRTSSKETAQRRLSANCKSTRDEKFSSVNERDKKNNEISPSPWIREEKEKLQKQQMEGARRVRDGEIEFLQSLPERTSKQDEWLRILLLEREFQRRAEEVGDEDEDEEDESLFERAETRERMLIMERDQGTSNKQPVNRNEHKNATSSSDHWLMASQAKQRHRSNDSCASSHNANGSFEVQQLNDLLETMNMSPVIRQECSPGDTNKRPSSNSVENTCYENKDSLPRATSSGSYDSSEYTPTEVQNMSSSRHMKADTSIDFCYPVVQPCDSEKSLISDCPLVGNLSQIYQSDEAFTPEFVNPTRSKHVGDNCLPPSRNGKEFKISASSSDSIVSEMEETVQSKMALRVPLNVSKKNGSAENQSSLTERRRNHLAFENGTDNCRKPAVNGRISNSLISNHENDKYVRNRVVSPTNSKPPGRPISDLGISQYYMKPKANNDFQMDNEELEDKSPEYKKIWTSKPEKLTFLDKIKKFSLQTGEDDAPRDRVKNSRAQRELEIKFNGDPNRVISQTTS